MKKRPPVIAEWLLRRSVSRSIRDAVLGDFAEQFLHRREDSGSAAAAAWYWGMALRSLPAFILDSAQWSLVMLRGHITVALRNLAKYKTFSGVNILGLAIGLSCSAAMGIYVQHELSFDSFHEKSQRIYRLVNDITTGAGNMRSAATSPAVGPALASDFPEVARAVRLRRSKAVLANGGERIIADRAVYADQGFFDVFSFPLRTGDAATALQNPNSIILTPALARRLFGHKDPLGQTVTVNGEQRFRVTGLLREIPANSHLTFDAVISFATMEANRPRISQQWFFNSFYTFLLLTEGADPSDLRVKLPDFVADRIGAAQDEVGQTYEFDIEALGAIYLQSDYGVGNLGRQGSLAAVAVFAVIALGLLVIAFLNFINLSTARASERSREISMRKVVGSGRMQLIVQFMAESVLISVLAMAIAIPICRLLLPVLSQMAGMPDSLALTSRHLLQLLLAAIGLGIAAGCHPAFLMSGFKPILVLGGHFHAGWRLARLRKGLVTFQFALAIALTAATLVINGQLDFLLRQDLGFEKSRKLILDFDADEIVQQKRAIITAALRAYPDVLAVSFSSNRPGDAGYSAFSTEIETGQGDVVQLSNPVDTLKYE